MSLHLNRRDHDRLMDLRPDLLRKAFDTCPRKWSLSGVTFITIPDELASAIRAALA